ncbi:ribonuclease G [Halobacillus dabanensis]|uniref:Ribonuclease G n=1 Tax=Halobacillus dabanensis TaxID=240302 RepID=A0A1I3P4S6_HALDA|nr:ribonuclease E/G [Halobacillus dabanensis]SFJ16534.1 ribonuclease G [Halobacillus dabanensis]
MRKLVIQTKPLEKTGVVIENEEICEYVFDRPGVRTLTGSIFYGEVTRIDKGLGAAFVDIGKERPAFLRKEEIPWCDGKIDSTLVIGEKMAIQITKEPIGNKGAQATADITLPGLYIVYQPYAKGNIALSKKLGKEKRGQLEGLLKSELSESEGAIVRTAAGTEDKQVITEEVRVLKAQWEDIEKSKPKKPQLLWEEQLIPDKLIRKFPVTSIEGIMVDDPTVSRNLREKYPSLSPRIQWEKNVSSHLPVSISVLQEKLTKSVVEMDNGVQLVIENTEAMTVIDVNSHQVKGKSFSNSQAFEVNLLAAREIQKQIRLRNLSGIIIIDFISMKSREKEKRLLAEMKHLVKNDPIRTDVLGMTSLGLMEMTRKREWQGFAASLIEVKEIGFTAETNLYRLERDLLEKRNSEAVLIAVHPDLLETKKRLLSDSISSKIPQELFVRMDTDIHGYQIELEGSLDMIREAIQRRGYHVDNLF